MLDPPHVRPAVGAQTSSVRPRLDEILIIVSAIEQKNAGLEKRRIEKRRIEK
jgi:hypothetical protein